MSQLNFVNNIASGVEKIGLEHAVLIYALAKIPYDSVEDRDALFDEIGGGRGR